MERVGPSIDFTSTIGEDKANMVAAAVFPASSLSRKQSEILGSILQGIPRGALTEIAGPASSGRTSFLCALLAEATAGEEFCALIDVEDRFDPSSAAASGARLSQILWVRCGGNAEHALKAADLLASAGGFGLVAIDLADTPAKISRRIPLAAWFRLRHAVENTRTALVSVGACVHASSCSALKIELRRNRAIWRGCRLLDGFETIATRVENHRPAKNTLRLAR